MGGMDLFRARGEEMAEDLRVVKTRRAIEGAMERLLVEKPFDAITVQAILDEALVNRKTFYSHYRDKYDLVRKMADEFMADVHAMVVVRKSAGSDTEGPFAAIDALYEQLLAKRTLALALWDVKTEGLDFSGELAATVEQAYLSHFGAEGVGDPALQAKMVSAMVVTMLRYKLEAGEPFTSVDIHRELDVLHRRSMGGR